MKKASKIKSYRKGQHVILEIGVEGGKILYKLTAAYAIAIAKGIDRVLGKNKKSL